MWSVVHEPAFKPLDDKSPFLSRINEIDKDDKYQAFCACELERQTTYGYAWPY